MKTTLKYKCTMYESCLGGYMEEDCPLPLLELGCYEGIVIIDWIQYITLEDILDDRYTKL